MPLKVLKSIPRSLVETGKDINAMPSCLLMEISTYYPSSNVIIVIRWNITKYRNRGVGRLWNVSDKTVESGLEKTGPCYII